MKILPKYQTFVKRTIAGFIDGLVFIPFDFLGDYFIHTFGHSFIIPWSFLNTIILTLYFVIGHGKYGQTLGKKAMAIKVLDLDEKNLIGYKRAFIRESIYFFVSTIGLIYFLFTQRNKGLSDFSELQTNPVDDFISLTTGVWFILEIVTMIFNSKRRALHDFMAGSVVVDTDELKKEKYLASLQNSFEPVQ
jgi:uncharacterized RDD family membrane protein YckC